MIHRGIFFAFLTLILTCEGISLCGTRRIELLTIARGNDKGTGGHSSLRIDDKSYTFNVYPGGEKKLILKKRDIETFFLDYNIFQERDIIGLSLDLSDEGVEKIEKSLDFTISKQAEGLLQYEYSLIDNNCVNPIRGLLNGAYPDRFIESDFASSIPYLYMQRVEKSYPVLEKKVYLSRRHRKLLRKFSPGEYLVPFSSISPPPESWRFIYTEDLKGAGVILRPVAGATNIVSGALQMVYGMAAAFRGKSDFLYGLRGIIRSFPELLFIPFTMARGYSIPDRHFFYGNSDDKLFLDYRIPELEFIVKLSENGRAEELFQKPGFENIYDSDRSNDIIGWRPVLEPDISEETKERIIRGRINDYYNDSFLRVLKLRDFYLVFNKKRTLNIQSLKEYKEASGTCRRGSGVSVMILERRIAPPGSYPAFSKGIDFVDFSRSELRPSEGRAHALDSALILRKFAPGAHVTIANYVFNSEMASAVDFAISEGFDIILHAELHPSLGQASPRCLEDAPVNLLAKRAFEAGVIWINSAGNFRESFYKTPFMKEGEVQKTTFRVRKGKKVRLDFNWRGCGVEEGEDDRYLIEVFSGRERPVARTEKKNLEIIIPRSGDYTVRIRALRLNEARRNHVFRVYSNVRLSPSSFNSSSLASPANSKYVFTIGASRRGRPVSYSSEDDITNVWDKPEFYAPGTFPHPRIPDRRFSGTSSAAAYAAAFFAILFGE